MDNERNKLRDKLFAKPENVHELLFGKPSSFDALSLALAQTNSSRFTPDPNIWNKAIYTLKTVLRAQGSPMFDDFNFDLRKPENPTSFQTFQFLSHLRRSESLVLWTNIGEGQYEMPEKAKEDIRNRQGPLFDQEQVYIRHISLVLDEKLGLKK